MNEASTGNPTRPNRKGKLAIILILLCGSLFLLRQPILRRIGGALVHEDPIVAGADILVIGGDGASHEALRWLAQYGQAKLLLAEKLPPRVVQIGATQSDAQRRKQLSREAGIAEDRVVIMVGSSMRGIRPIESVREWLSGQPDRSVQLLCSEFSSFGLRRMIDRQLPEEISAKISIRPLSDRRYSVQNWWHSRLGIRDVFQAYLGLTRSILGLYAPEPPPYLSPDEYEEAFLVSLRRS